MAGRQTQPATPKTQRTDASVEDFLAGVPDARRRADARVATALMREVTASDPAMWGPSIIGFGERRLVYASGRELDWFTIGLSPRKTALTLYVLEQFDDHRDLLDHLGPHTLGKGCLYIKRLSDVDESALRELVARAWNAGNP